MHMVSGQQSHGSALQYFSLAHSPTVCIALFSLFDGWPWQQDAFLLTASKPIHLKASVEPTNCSTRKGHRSLYSGDFPSRPLSKSWQCFVFPQISVLPKIPSPDPKHFHPSCSVSQLRNSAVLLLPRNHCGTTFSERFSLSPWRKGWGLWYRHLCPLRWFVYPGVRFPKKMGALKSEKEHSKQKVNVELFSCHQKEDLGTSLVTLESTLLTMDVSFFQSQELLLQEWVFEIDVPSRREWVFVHPLSISDWCWKCLYHLKYR